MKNINFETDTSTLNLDAVHEGFQAITGMKHDRPDGLLAVNYQVQYDDTNLWVTYPDEVDQVDIENVVNSPGVRIAP